MQRWIILVDLDAFFASVEELLDPSLRGKPLIVGGAPDKRGVVSSASYAARAYGVRSAMPVSQALRLCPHALLLHGHYDQYARHSRAVMAILREITPAMEQVSIDEAFLDVTGCELLWGPARQIGELIQRRVADEVGLPVSLGIATNKLVAKIACEVGKPHGLVLVPPGEEADFLAPLPIERLWGVGQVTAGRLRELGIRTIGELAAWSEGELAAEFGENGHHLYAAARGLDSGPVHSGRERRSISQERTFASDVGDHEVLLNTLLEMSEHVARCLRERGLVAQTVRLKLRLPDFTTNTRQMTLGQPTDQGQIIAAQARELFEHYWHVGQRLRLLGVGVSGLLERGGYQLSLFDHSDQRRTRLNAALDRIRDRYGHEAIQRASLLRRKRAQEADEDQEGD